MFEFEAWHSVKPVVKFQTFYLKLSLKVRWVCQRRIRHLRLWNLRRNPHWRRALSQSPLWILQRVLLPTKESSLKAGVWTHQPVSLFLCHLRFPWTLFSKKAGTKHQKYCSPNEHKSKWNITKPCFRHVFGTAWLPSISEGADALGDPGYPSAWLCKCCCKVHIS